MNIELASVPAAQVAADALLVWAYEQEAPAEGSLAPLDQATGGRLRELAAAGELRGKWLEQLLLHFPPGLAARRLAVLGAGRRDRFTTAELRRLAGAAVRWLKPRNIRHLALLLREGFDDPAAVQAAVEGLLLGDFEPDRYRTADEPRPALESVTLLAPATAAHRAALERGRIVAEAQNWARELGNEPSNLLTPRALAERAAAMAGQYGLQAEIFDERRIEELGMGALLGVARGSAEPPRFILLRYDPPGAPADGPVFGLVGKAITFDTGGISIKPAKGMEKMKYDMAGGAAMLAVLRAVAALKPPVRVRALVPATENMPGGRAQKPGDIVRSLEGKTIEVLNTDAEGRLILADALSYARRIGCTHLVDAATLTGAIVVALSTVNVGVFGSDAALVERFLDCARAAGEKMWPMPVDDDYRDMMRGRFADLQNISSGEGGGACTAAAFLREFTGDCPWIHLDIAGTAWLDDARPWMAHGATGVGVRTLTEFLLRQAQAASGGNAVQHHP